MAQFCHGRRHLGDHVTGVVAAVWDTGVVLRQSHGTSHPSEEHQMSKRARKRRSRKGNAANHGRKPNT